MTRARRLAGVGAVLAAAALLVPAAPASAAGHAANRGYPVQVRVDDISPPTPTATKTPSPLIVTLTLTNTTARTFDNITIVGERGDPISTQEQLDTVLPHPKLPASSGLPIPAQPAVHVDELGNEPVTVTFQTTTSNQSDGKGICLCSRGIVYPLFFSANTVVGGVNQPIGVAATYLPAFDNLRSDFPTVAPNRVSWIWPLLDRPHRLTEDTVFTDDALAAEVAPDGRLSRALEVVNQLPRRFPITLLVDPDLLDEVEVMADPSKPYTVMTKDGKTIPGTGQADASNWLNQFHELLSTHPQAQVELTPYGDPDLESLTARRLSWSAEMPASMAARVSGALGGRPISGTLAWPATGAISRPTLRRLAGQDVNTVVLNSAAVRTGVSGGAITPGLVRLGVGPTRDVAAALTSPTIERSVASAVTQGRDGSGALPALLAQLAIRPAQEPNSEHAVTLTPPRYVDPDVAAAVQTIKETSTSVFARPISLSAAVGDDLTPIPPSHLAPVPPAATASATAYNTMSAATTARTTDLRIIRSLLDASDSGAAAFEQSLPIAIQRAESSAWRFRSNSRAGAHFADQLTDTIDRITRGVRIVQSARTYTFGSNTAPLPITVDNELPYPVRIRIEIVTNPPGVLGFQAKKIGIQSVEATQKRTFNIPTTIEHSGRIRVEAHLLTARGIRLTAHPPIQMTVRSTALGLIGVVITIVAGVVLGIALLWRLLRRVRQRRASGGPPAVARVPEVEPVG